MQYMLRISVACLALSAKAMEESSAVSLLLESQKPGKVDTKTLVASLTTVSKGLLAEDKKALAMSRKDATECKKKQQDLKLALNKGKRAVAMGTADYDKTSAQVNALSASLAELKGQRDASNKQIDTLQAKLKKMRKDKGLLKKGAAKALQQVEAVIAKTFLRESNEHHKAAPSLEKQASNLEALSESLSFLQTDAAWSEVDGEETDKQDSENGINLEALSESLNFEQTEAAGSEETDGGEEKHESKKTAGKSKQSKPISLLKADKQAVVAANAATQKGFNAEEKKIIDLIKTERKKLSSLEDNMQDLQPAISNKLKQAMEINRTLDAANRGLKKDQMLMNAETQKCTTVSTNLNKQFKQRRAVTNDVSMAAKVLSAMNSFLSLSFSKDLDGLTEGAAPAFLQVVSEHEQEALALSFIQENEGEGEGSESEADAGLEEMAENYGAQAVEGPFDSVTKMISGLIASLKAQANAEVNQHQFCQDSLSKNRNDRIAKKNSIDTLTSTIRWSKMAIIRLQDDDKYLTGELARLSAMQTAEKKELDVETKRVNKEFAEHKLGDQVITKAVLILTQLCKLKGSFIQDTSLLQDDQQSSSMTASRFNQCKEAAKLLTSASKNMKALDVLTKDYLKAYTLVSNKISGDAMKGAEARSSELKSTKAASAQRASELATASKDVKEAGKELALIDKAKKQLETSCSRVETREQKMARRKEEIDALKEALKVLNGEAIPA